METIFKLNSPLTKDDWNLITDAEFEHSDGVTFTTPSGKEVEFRKVVHGEWVECDDSWDGVYYECSACKEAFTLIDGTPTDNLYNFCPNCGADMRGERDG